MADEIKITMTQKKEPRRLIYFSDGVVEEYSTDEEDISKTKDTQEIVAIDLSKLSWPDYLWNRTFNFLNVALSKADYCGEKLAWMLGITSPKYQYAIDEYHRQQQLIQEEEEFEERERQADLERKAKNKELRKANQSKTLTEKVLEKDSQTKNIKESTSQFECLENSNNTNQLDLSYLNGPYSELECIDGVTAKLEDTKINDFKVEISSSKLAYVNKAYDHMDSNDA